MSAPARELAPWELALTPTLVVSTAIATRDFQDVHHDRDLARAKGTRDIFLNILTTTGLVQRYVGEWAREELGPDCRIASCALRLGAPAYPYDTLTFTGTAITEGDTTTVDVLGTVSIGSHVTATVTVVDS
jgi:hypothetical protein